MKLPILVKLHVVMTNAGYINLHSSGANCLPLGIGEKSAGRNQRIPAEYILKRFNCGIYNDQSTN